MPYIKQENRDSINTLLHPLAGKIYNGGELNYCMFFLAARQCFNCNMDPSYARRAETYGHMMACAGEFKRRFLDPYEQQKMKENGDIDIYPSEAK